MRVVLFADGEAGGLGERLSADGVALEPVSLPAPEGDASSAALVGALRGAEDALEGEEPAAVLVAGDGDAALAATLTAVKLQIPTGWLRPAGAGEDGLVARLADTSLDATAPAADLGSAIRDLAARTISAP